MHDVVSTAPITDTLPIESSAAAPDTSRAYLLVHDGGVSRVVFLPPGAEVTVGRSPAATLRSEDPSVSRLHARIFPIRVQGPPHRGLGRRAPTRTEGCRPGSLTRRRRFNDRCDKLVPLRALGRMNELI